LKAAHDARFAPAVAGTQILFIIKSGILVSSANTSTYALTNPSTWAAGVLITLQIESGAFVVGRGGDGGDGGQVFSATISPQNGEDGGNGFFIDYALSVDNAGIVSGGSGGGGGSGAAKRIGFAHAVYADAPAGGGGWPYGVAGYSTLITAGGGVIAGGLTDGDDADGSGGGNGGSGVTIKDEFDTIKYIEVVIGDAGDGGGKYAIDGTDGADATSSSVNFASTPTEQTGALGGTAGDAIHGDSFITWINTGTIYGTVS